MVNQKQMESEDKVSVFKNICLGLQSSDRKVRKQTYLDTETYLSNNIDLSDKELQVLFTETYVYFLNGLRDKAEAVREQAIKFITFLVIHKLPLNDFFLTYIFPVIVERIGTVELIEESEEIRLQMLQLLNEIISRYSNTVQLKPFLNDSVIILCEIVKDKYPAIKELSCRTIIKLAEALPKDFHNQAEALIAPVLSCFSHQRYKVRVEAIFAIGEIVMHSTYKGLEETVGPLAERLFDQIPVVRRAVGKVAGRWLLEYRDRYSFFHKILPLLLTGLNDEVLETRNDAAEIWERVGLQYQKENEKDLKDELDYLTARPAHYPPALVRPNAGCRALVKRHLGKMAPALARELVDSWQEDVRVRCCQLLCALAWHAEADAALHLPALLPAMIAAARRDDGNAAIAGNVAMTGETFGRFIGFDTWWALVRPAIEDGPHHGHLAVLGSLVRGAAAERLPAAAVEEMAAALADDGVCSGRKEKYQLELLGCVDALAQKHNLGTENSTGYSLFKIIVTLLALKHPDIEEKAIEDVMGRLRTVLKVDDEQLWRSYAAPLLAHVAVDAKLWTPAAVNRRVFHAALTRGGAALGRHLDAVGAVLRDALDVEADAEARLETFYVLAEAFERKEEMFRDAVEGGRFLEELVRGVFVPALVWKAGATAEALRTMAAACLKHALAPAFPPAALRRVADELLPLLASLTEDASWRSRQSAIECVALLPLDRCEDLVAVYPEILKRLDDPIDKVRLCALRNLPAVLGNVPMGFQAAHYQAHHELIVDTLLTHFDDDDEQVQLLVYDVLEVMAAINKRVLLDKIERHKPLLHNRAGCDRLLRNFEGLRIEEVDC